MAESLCIEPQITNSKIDIEQKEFLFTNKNLIFLFIPILIELFLEYAVGFADSIMVSHVGEAAVSGVSLVNFIMQLLISLFAAICTGGAVIAGQYLGKKDKNNSIQAADQLVWFVGILSTVIMIITLMLKSFIIGTLFGHISEEVRANAEIYYNIVIPSIPFLALIAINVVILTLLPGILNIYHLSEVTYHLTYQLVFWHGVVAVFIWPLAYSQPVTFRSAGDARFPMLTATISMFICGIFMSYIFVQVFGFGLFGTYLAMFMDWVVKAIIFTVRYLSGRWMRFKLI